MIRNKETQRQLFWFVIAGVCAFFIDGGILQFLTSVLDLSPYIGRIFSFSTAVVFTWLVNRHFSFRMNKPLSVREFVKYLSAQSVGLSVNVAVYYLAIWQISLTHDYPIIALIPATAISMCFNFLSMKFLVFKKPKPFNE